MQSAGKHAAGVKRGKPGIKVATSGQSQQMQLTQWNNQNSKKEHATRAEGGKTCSRCLARENGQSVRRAGKRALSQVRIGFGFARRGRKTRNMRSFFGGSRREQKEQLFSLLRPWQTGDYVLFVFSLKIIQSLGCRSLQKGILNSANRRNVMYGCWDKMRSVPWNIFIQR